MNLPYKLVRTCNACSEQYDVFDRDNQIGYLRLRHGVFSAYVPHCGGTKVFQADDMQGDGIFEEHERAQYLASACAAIQKYWQDVRSA